jgi:hypothetical protein
MPLAADAKILRSYGGANIGFMWFCCHWDFWRAESCFIIQF